MPPEDRVRLLHMIEAADEAMRFVAGQSASMLATAGKRCLPRSAASRSLAKPRRACPP
jgi:hypothetical protein